MIIIDDAADSAHIKKTRLSLVLRVARSSVLEKTVKGLYVIVRV